VASQLVRPPFDLEVLVFDWTLDTPTKQIIEEALGAASMCWQYPDKAGIFVTSRAEAIADEVLTILYQKSTGNKMSQHHSSTHS
jgi:hypothetical protein